MALSILYWISPYGKILKQSNTTHIQQVVKNPQVFGLQKDYIEKVYKRHNEIIGNEGNAREEIMDVLFKRGFIRARLYVNQFWSITLSNFNRKAKKSLAKWAEDASKDKSSGKYMPVRILDVRGNKMYQEWDVNDIMYDKHINENEKDDKDSIRFFIPEIVELFEDLEYRPTKFSDFI